jgi:cell shape-determining protein MreC
MTEERLDLKKEVFNKAQYIKTIDTSFDQLGVTTITEDLQTEPTVEEFFGLYNSLFYNIPALGETNSHEYLVKTSGEYINFEEVNEEIEALRAEITQLRQDLLNLQIENIQLAANQSDDPATDLALQRAAKKLNVSTSELIKTSTDLSSNTITSTNGE